MALENFEFISTPVLHFGTGKLNSLPGFIQNRGLRFILFITGQHFVSTKDWDKLTHEISDKGIRFETQTVHGEPTVDVVNRIVSQWRNSFVDVVVAIGGGSVLDTGKAVSAMLTVEGLVEEYVEKLGTRQHPGTKIPFIAIPTTAGTGSESTCNAVVSKPGINGFKKSLRHNNFIPDVAIIDPELLYSCPTEVTAASGLDTFTQLVESYLSPCANTYTDALALSGIKCVKDQLINSFNNPENPHARSAMAYAAYLSGLTLSNAGLGVVHGFASAIGGMFNVPHGVICGTMLASCTQKNIEKLTEQRTFVPLEKYAKLGCLINNQFYQKMNETHIKGREMLISKISEWTDKMKIPRLSHYGVVEKDIEKIVPVTENKNNPVMLSGEDLTEILLKQFVC